jgi:DNA-directed RNA polymerase alpha subunit
MKVVIVEVSSNDELKNLLEMLDSSQAPETATEEPPPEAVMEEQTPETVTETQAQAPEPEPTAPEMPLEELSISSRVVKVLHEKGIDTVPALTRLRERDLKKIPQIGQASLREIKNALHKKNMRLRRRDFKGVA